MSRHKSKPTKRAGRVRHGEGIAHYLTMGADRSLRKLRAHYCETMAHPPALVTIEKWSARFDWTARAKEHDERVAIRLGKKAEDTAVEQTWDKAKTLTDLAQKALDKAIAGLDGGKITADDAYQVQALLNAAVTALKHVELVSGRATERFYEPVTKHAPDSIKEMLAEMAAEKAPERLAGGEVEVIEDAPADAAKLIDVPRN